MPLIGIPVLCSMCFKYFISSVALQVIIKSHPHVAVSMVFSSSKIFFDCIRFNKWVSQETACPVFISLQRLDSWWVVVRRVLILGTGVSVGSSYSAILNTLDFKS
jgi:hypothetical protein